MIYGIASLSVFPIRKGTSETSEMVSQLLFGERYRVLAEKDQWVRIVTDFDHYEGWISRNQHVEITGSEYRRISALSPFILPIPYAEAIPAGSDDVSFMIAAGSELPDWDRENRLVRFGDRSYHISGFDGTIPPNTAVHIIRTARQFLHTPYLWGGRSFFGCDCSGFVQTVCKIHGISLPRDAREQADLGEAVPSLEESAPCDLVFFTNGGKQVRHVGLLISKQEIIHCSGSVRTDRIDHTGIYNEEMKAYSHSCYTIRRLDAQFRSK